MTYETPSALRMALERRLQTRSDETGIGLDRLRRRVLLERIVARLATAEPGLWVLKGGMALEVRLRDAARLTRDIDLGLRDSFADSADLHGRLIDALATDPDGDGFEITPGPPAPLREDGGGHLTWRAAVSAQLAGKRFGGTQLDISPRPHELGLTDRVEMPNSLDFAGIPATVVEIIDIHRHAAEKLHALCRDFGDRENTRVRDLVDLVILIEHDQIDPAEVATSVRQVWCERDADTPPIALPSLPESWPDRYEQLATNHDLHTQSFDAAVTLAGRLWADMFPTQET
jgi:Nucleotidyl transferase AbiEii toxin, Type IV TA system